MSSIHEVAKLLGISATAIRKYEEKGLLTFVRNAENDYREFDAMTVGMLVRIRQLRQAGFSISEINEILNKYDRKEIGEKLVQRQIQIERQIEQLQKLKQELGNWKEDMDSIGQGIVWGSMPELCYIKYLDMVDRIVSLSPNATKAQEYLIQMPFSFPGNFFPLEEVLQQEKRNYDCETGIFFARNKCDVLPEAVDRIIPGGECVIFPYNSEQSKNFGCEIFEEVRREIESKGYRISGNVINRIFLTTRQHSSDHYATWMRFFVPVEKIDEKFTKNP